jgi:uncharacterized protein (TIGR02588 family)
MAGEKKKSRSENAHEESPSRLEWLFAAVGVLVVSSAVGFLIYRGATKDDLPPAIKIEVESIAPTGDNYLVNFRVSNTGDTTAADLTIEGELKNGEKAEETSDVTMTYLPAKSVRRGGLFFTKNPRDFQLRIRAKGYEQP